MEEATGSSPVSSTIHWMCGERGRDALLRVRFQETRLMAAQQRSPTVALEPAHSKRERAAFHPAKPIIPLVALPVTNLDSSTAL